MKHLAVALIAGWAMPALALAASSMTPGEVFELASRSVVVVHGVNQEGRPATQGSGVVIAPGVVVTNCHVLGLTTSARVLHGGRARPAVLRHADAKRDLCSLSVEGLSAPPAQLGGVFPVQVGDRVYAIGTPRGFELTLSEGLVSGLRPTAGGAVLQITAPVSPGSSGGGLFDTSGKLVGVTTSQWLESQQINFAVPVEWIEELPLRDTAIGKSTDASRFEMSAEEGRVALNALGAELSKSDPRYSAKVPILLPRLRRIIDTQPPHQWVASARRAYAELEDPSLDAPITMNDASFTAEDGRVALNTLGAALQARDPSGYAAKFPQLAKEVARIKGTLPPRDWVAATTRAYDQISLSSQSPSSRLQAQETAEEQCKAFVLSSPGVASKLYAADVGSLSEVCDCAATLSIAPLSNEQAAGISRGDDVGPAFKRVLQVNFAKCVQLAN